MERWQALRCRIFGHRWEMEQYTQHDRDGRLLDVVVQHRCLRCGKVESTHG